MLFFLISCFSVILLSKSLAKPPMKSDWRLLSPWFWRELSSFLVSWFQKGGLVIRPLKQKMSFGSKPANTEKEKISLLDLPDLTLECILEKLSPAGLCNMAGVCSSLRDRCTSDHLWEKHMKQKWGRVIGDVAKREWQWHLVSRQRSSLMNNKKQTGFFWSLYSCWPFSWSERKTESNTEPRSSLPVDSIMAWYVSLESGKFWFPAQVYNRENGHVGFMLSCYDAQLSYDSRTDTFRARYSPHGRRMVEENISWDRLRAPAVDTPSHVLHNSDCLHDLKPGDHIEIQWRRNKEFPYGWWYGVVGHLESCGRNEHHCLCFYKDTVVLEFNQYPTGSRWRQMMINRKDHREVGNEADGFYGGIRKIYKEEEISMWKSLWPRHALE